MKGFWKVVGAAAVGWRLLGPAFTPRFRPPQAHPWRLPGRTVYVGDREFLVREAGPPDAEPVLLVHGLGGSSIGEWYRVGPRLADDHRVVLVDHRNHGLSARTTERFDISDLADDLAGVVAALGLGPITVVGYSMGGAVAQELAHRHRWAVRRLVLIGAFATHPPRVRRARQVATWLIRAWERLTGVGSPETRALYLRWTGAVDVDHARWLWEETHRRDPEAGAVSSYALLRFDSTPWIGRLDVPALVIVPVQDQLVPAAWQYDLAARLPDAELVELADARHEAPWTHPESIARAVAEFVKRR